MIIAQITDSHVVAQGHRYYDIVDTNAFLARAIAHLNALDPRPDVVVATGDLVSKGTNKEYAALREILSDLTIPIYVIPGNHDDREALRRAFADHAYLPHDGDFLHYVIEEYELRLIALDTVVPGSGAGALCHAQLGWLEQRLGEAPSRPTIVLMHHPPFPTGIAHMDASSCTGADGLATIVSRFSNVERILCGHVHRAIQVRWADTVACSAPSTAYQVALNLGLDDPGEFTLEPPACLLHVWLDGVGLVSHTSYIGEFEGPYRFLKQRTNRFETER